MDEEGLFGEMLPMEKLQRIRHEFYDNPPDLVIVAGTSALFPYIAEPVVIESGSMSVVLGLSRPVTRTLSSQLLLASMSTR